MTRQITWNCLVEERMKTVNVFNEVECFKAIRELINLYFSGDKSSVEEKIENLKADKAEAAIKSPLEGKLFRGWNVDYYCQPVEWVVLKNKKA